MAGYNWLETKEKYVKQHDAITASVLLCNHYASFLSSIMIKHVYTLVHVHVWQIFLIQLLMYIHVHVLRFWLINISQHFEGWKIPLIRMSFLWKF